MAEYQEACHFAGEVLKVGGCYRYPGPQTYPPLHPEPLDLIGIAKCHNDKGEGWWVIAADPTLLSFCMTPEEKKYQPPFYFGRLLSTLLGIYAPTAADCGP